MVDNTNVAFKDFAWYLRHTPGHYHVEVVSLDCASQRDVDTFHARCQHAVPKAIIGRMFGRWQAELQSNAQLLQDWSRSRPVDRQLWQLCLHQSIASSPRPHELMQQYASEVDYMETLIESTGGGDLQSWLSGRGCLHFNKVRRRSHLLMGVDGVHSTTFLDVRQELEHEFLKQYVAHNGPKYLCEYASRPCFPLYFDLDYESETLESSLSTAVDKDGNWSGTASSRKWSVVVRTLQQVLVESYPPREDDTWLRMVVVGTGAATRNGEHFKSGGHIHVPGVCVTEAVALMLRSAFVSAVSTRLGESETAWNRFVDIEVINQHRTLRMFGSNKVTRGADVGRAYSLIAVVTGSGEVDKDEMDKLSVDPVVLLREISIRSTPRATETPGFSRKLQL